MLSLMKISNQQTLKFTEEKSTFLQEDSHANPTPLQEKEKGRMTSDIYGQRCLEQFERFPRVGLWAKTFAGLLIGMGDWYSTRCNLIWKLKGTKSNRFYFQLQASVRHTEEIESGLLLTPTSVMTNEPPEKMRERIEMNGYNAGTKFGSVLSQILYGNFLPTPTVRDWKGKQANEYKQDRGEIVEFKMTSLPGIAEKMGLNSMMPTPTASDSPVKNTGKRKQDGLQKRAFQITGKTSQLNPRFVAEMMGFPPNWTELPFQSGEMKA